MPMASPNIRFELLERYFVLSQLPIGGKQCVLPRLVHVSLTI